MKHFILHIFLGFCLLTLLIAPLTAHAGPTVIRDVEIENYIEKWTHDVVEAAGLQTEQINFVLIQDPHINAFVAGGPNIFIYTGLLEKSDNPDEIIGVVAHELGHIRGGHLVRLRDSIENAAYQSLFGTLLGAGAAILTGEGQLGTAIALGSQATAQNNFLSFSRTQEASADQAALSYLQGAEIDPHGLVTFMEKLEDQELLPASQQSEYIRTHPLTRDRISALEQGYKQSAYKQNALPAQWNEDHRRMIAKIRGFITPEQVSWLYPDKTADIPSLYAHAIAAYRLNNVPQAIKDIDVLIGKEPDNPYFHELKGQVEFESGDIDASVSSYEKAVTLLPSASMFRVAYAHALIESARNDQTDMLEKALVELKRAETDTKNKSTRLHRLFATAYGRLGDTARASLHLAEESMLKGNHDLARKNAQRALEEFPSGSAEHLRAADLIAYIDYKQARAKEREQNRKRP